MANKTTIGASFYAICPKCNELIPFQGSDIQYYKPIGYELEYKQYANQYEAIDTGKIIICPFCEEASKAKDYQFIVNDF